MIRALPDFPNDEVHLSALESIGDTPFPVLMDENADPDDELPVVAIVLRYGDEGMRIAERLADALNGEAPA